MRTREYYPFQSPRGLEWENNLAKLKDNYKYLDKYIYLSNRQMSVPSLSSA